MNKMSASLLLISVVACSGPLGVEPIGQADPLLNITTQGKAVPNLVIEKISGDCASGITVWVHGENLSPRSRFGSQWLNKTDLTSLGPAQVALGNGNKKSVSWTTFWPSATINPATGGKFNGYANGVVTDAYTGIVHETGPVFIGPAC